jgi:hypothetical protein
MRRFSAHTANKADKELYDNQSPEQRRLIAGADTLLRQEKIRKRAASKAYWKSKRMPVERSFNAIPGQQIRGRRARACSLTLTKANLETILRSEHGKQQFLEWLNKEVLPLLVEDSE